MLDGQVTAATRYFRSGAAAAMILVIALGALLAAALVTQRSAWSIERALLAQQQKIDQLTDMELLFAESRRANLAMLDRLRQQDVPLSQQSFNALREQIQQVRAALTKLVSAQTTPRETAATQALDAALRTYEAEVLTAFDLSSPGNVSGPRAGATFTRADATRVLASSANADLVQAQLRRLRLAAQAEVASLATNLDENRTALPSSPVFPLLAVVLVLGALYLVRRGKDPVIIGSPALGTGGRVVPSLAEVATPAPPADPSAGYPMPADHEQAAYSRELGRAIRLVAQCSHALVHACSETELVQDILRRIVDSGGFGVAWVGYWNDDSTDFRIVAQTLRKGLDEASCNALTKAEEFGRSQAAATVRRGQIMVTDESPASPSYERWFERAADAGMRSAISVPLRNPGGIFGVLVVYSETAGAVAPGQIELLGELADDLAFGIAALRERDARRLTDSPYDDISQVDPLTGLANGVRFVEHVREALRNAQGSSRPVIVMKISVERLRSVNEIMGSHAGDFLLKSVAERLTSATRNGIVARTAGDRFGVVVADGGDDMQPLSFARTLLNAVMMPLELAGSEYYPNACIGVSMYPHDGQTAEAQMRNAAVALSQARALGGGTIQFYDPVSADQEAAGFALETALRAALDHGEFVLHFQPKADLVTGRISGAEALVRWNHPTMGLMPPGQFIGLAEATGLIGPLGTWVIQEACRQIAAWRNQGLPDCPVSVNLSPIQFRHADLVSTVRRALTDHGVKPASLELELTEGAVMHDMQSGIDTLRALRAIGVRCALDDFGTGHSSLNYLKHLPIERLKIDQSFVRDLTTEPGSAAICNAIINIAHNLDLKVVAEGVETEAQLSYLRRCGCDEVQGFYFSPGVPADDFAQMLRSRTRLPAPTYAPGARTLLIVDDEVNVLSALRRVLQPEGFEIILADSGPKALAILAMRETQVILTDQRMPEMSGTEFLARVRKLYPRTVRMVLSGYADLDTVIASVNRGTVFRFITKPCNADVLQEHVREAFRHYDQQLSQHMAPRAPRRRPAAKALREQPHTHN
ncbi:EAL domain-containing protein [Tahibacter amnicola]|uniref:EAL domain-containing protein n=1 Tax=Tahibacter amnicola TaxID=2976241 RepID=A0ABY6BKT0_9GAMM|nr:EAL domain-containing protein [Tahibacter amnicola]UXI70382.1 EAL domain-containing protein [Tahibacter amnicola]